MTTATRKPAWGGLLAARLEHANRYQEQHQEHESTRIKGQEGPSVPKISPQTRGAMAFAALSRATEIPNIPPISPGSIRLVIKLLIAGWSIPPPMAVGIMATEIQATPSQPVFHRTGAAPVSSWSSDFLVPAS